MNYVLINSPSHRSFEVSYNLWDGLLVSLVELGARFAGYNAFASEIRRSCKLPIAVNIAEESQCFTLWSIDVWNVGQHIHWQVIDNLCRELDPQSILGPATQCLKIDLVQLGELSQVNNLTKSDLKAIHTVWR